jgi:type I restriction enzyme S subunit
MNIVGPPLGKVSIVSEIYPEWNINQAIAIFRPEIGLDRKFLAYALLTEAVLFRITGKAKATAGQFNLTLEQCRMLPLPLPPMTEQERIVAEVERRLSVVDNLEQVVKANLKRAERLRQAILKEAFAGRLVPQNPADEPAGVLLERIKVARAANAGVGKPKRAAKKEQKAFEL